MNRLLYIPLRLACDLGSISSRMVNAIVFNGSTAQTLSARAYLDGRDSRSWRIIGRGINALLFWQADHVRCAWEQEDRIALAQCRDNHSLLIDWATGLVGSITD